MHVREDLEFIGAAHVIAVAGCAVRDQPVIAIVFYLSGLERFNHALFFGHTADPLIRFHTHCLYLRVVLAKTLFLLVISSETKNLM